MIRQNEEEGTPPWLRAGPGRPAKIRAFQRWKVPSTKWKIGADIGELLCGCEESQMSTSSAKDGRTRPSSWVGEITGSAVDRRGGNGRRRDTREPLQEAEPHS
ncbi:hypothetical protein NL676_034303 [Syzygium grande]|nr:hypothetical protein NL676_034303 [Syzygium grande]